MHKVPWWLLPILVMSMIAGACFEKWQRPGDLIPDYRVERIR